MSRGIYSLDEVFTIGFTSKNLKWYSIKNAYIFRTISDNGSVSNLTLS